MKKTLLKSLALAAVGSLFVAGSAMALPQQIDGNYWYDTDLTTGGNGSISQMQMQIPGSSSSYIGDFGLYSLVDYGATSPVIKATLDILPLPNVFSGINVGTTVYFNQTGGTVWASTDTDWTDSNNVDLGSNEFGFYFKDNAGYTAYTDQALNGGDELVTSWISDSIIPITPPLYSAAFMLSDGQGGVAAAVQVDDVAPVPEPATMLLLGTGLVGIAGLRRKKAKKA